MYVHIYIYMNIEIYADEVLCLVAIDYFDGVEVLYVYVYTHVYIHIYTYIYICIYIYICVCVC